MADTPGTPPHLLALLSRLEAEPYRFGFFAVLRQLECAHPERPRLGESVLPGEDPIRLGQEISLSFHPSTLASLRTRGPAKPPRLDSFFLGLFGPNGPLPLHLTEYVRDRIRHGGDTTLKAFSDLFHHRMLSLFYRAWASADPAVNFDRPAQSRYFAYIGSLLGIGTPALRDRDALPDLAKLHFAGRLSCQSRNAEGLQAMLSGFFAVPVELEEFVGEWIDLPERDMCRLGASPETGTLGESILLGSRAWSGQHKIRLRFGPMGYEDYQRLLPGGASLKKLVALVKHYLTDELDWDVNLILRRDQVPPLTLGGAARLGWSTWLNGPPPAADPDDLNLRPLACAG